MAHPRKLIRQAVVAALTNATAAGARVKATRVEPHKSTKLPALAVYTLSEDVDESSMDTAPRELWRNLKLEVAGFVAHADSYPVDDAMDDLAEQIEAAMDVDRYFHDTAGGSILVDTSMQVLEDNGASDPLIGIVTLTYTIIYRTSPGSAVAADDFLRVDAKHQVTGGVSDTPVVEDTFTVRAP